MKWRVFFELLVSFSYVVNIFICLEYMWRLNKFSMWPAGIIFMNTVILFVQLTFYLLSLEKRVEKHDAAI